MAEIPGATITYTDYVTPLLPRSLNIPDAAGDVKVQDIWDTLSAEAAKSASLYYKPLIRRDLSGGKNVLSPTKTSGITLTMLFIQIRFPNQSGPSFIRKKVVDGNLIAVDLNGDAIEAIAESSFTNFQNEADVSAAQLGITFPVGKVVADNGNTVLSFKTDRTETDDDHWKNCLVRWKDNTLTAALRSQVALTPASGAYNGTTFFITVETPYTVIPQPGDEFELVNR